MMMLVYDKRLIQKLYEEHLRYPQTIICGKVIKCFFDKNNKLISYNNWIIDSDDFIESYDILPTGVAGFISTKLFL